MNKLNLLNEYVINLIQWIGECNTEEELEEISDIIEDDFQVGTISQKIYEFIGEELDDRLSDIIYGRLYHDKKTEK